MDDIDAPIRPDAHVNGTAAVGTGDAGQLKPGFLSGLAMAMREAAGRERERISGVVADDAAAHIEKVRSRAAIETEELRRLAEEDVAHIEEWSSQEVERVKAEATRKIEDRRSSLEAYLRQHDQIIETEIQGVDAAVREYGETLDRFFAELATTTDPSEIARRAEQLPHPPDLDEVRSTARANAMTRLAETEATDVAAATDVEAEPVAMAAETESATPADDAGTGGPLVGVMDDGAGSVEPSAAIEASAEEPVVAEAEPLVADAEPLVAEAEPVVAEAEAEPVSAETEAGPVTSEAEPVVAEAEPVVGEAVVEEAPTADEVPAAETPVTEPTPEPVGVMDPDSMRVPSWPAPAPSEPARIAPSIDHTSAAVRLLRSVAPWTAPTHAATRSEGDAD